MNGLERIQATFAGTPTDRPAVCLTASMYGAGLIDCPLAEYYTDALAYARGQSAVREAVGTDVLYTPFSIPLEAAAFGAEVRFFDHQPPNLARPALRSVDELPGLALPDIDAHPRLLYFREALRQMVAEHGDEVAIAAVCAAPVDLPAMLLGIDGWIETLLLDEAAARRVIELTSRHFVRWANALLADGAVFVVAPAAFANPLVVPAAFATGVAIPALRDAFAQVEGPIIAHSSGMRIAPCLEWLADLPNVLGFVVGSDESLADARRTVGPRALLAGNLDGPALGATSAAEIETRSLAVLAERAADPHFALSTSAADIALDTPLENLRALVRGAERFAGGARAP